MYRAKVEAPPQVNSCRSRLEFAWWPTVYILESEGERKSHWFWWTHYEVVERYRKLYCWKISDRCFYEWYVQHWCLEKVTPLTVKEYAERKHLKEAGV